MKSISITLICLLLLLSNSILPGSLPIEASSRKSAAQSSKKKTPSRISNSRISNGKKRKAESKVIRHKGRPILEPEPAIESGVKEDPESRKNWFIDQRRYPFESIPSDARRKAWEARPRRPIEALQQQPMWRPIGPAPTVSAFINNWGVTSGRINSIAISPANPQLVILGTSTGGIWRSTDGGENFVPVTDTQ
jgi:hypothetical protein